MGLRRLWRERLSARARTASWFVGVPLFGLLLDRTLKILVPEGTETNAVWRLLASLRDAMSYIPTDWLLVCAATAFAILVWDARNEVVAFAVGQWRFLVGPWKPTGRVFTYTSHVEDAAAISQAKNADRDSDFAALRSALAAKNREVADLRAQVAAKSKDPEIEKLRRIAEWIALTERRLRLAGFQEELPQIVKKADGLFDKIVNRPPSMRRHPDENPYFYRQQLELIREGYLSLVGKDVPELDSDRFYRDHPIVAVPGETPDMPDLARSERRKKYAQHNSFMDGARVILMRIPFALEKLDKQLAELQREANEYMRIRNKGKT